VGGLFAIWSLAMKFGVFIERDGVLNETHVEHSQQVIPLAPGQLRINPAAAGLVRRLKAAGFVVVATTNQPGLSRGYQSRRALDQMHARLLQELPLDDILLCPHDESDDCPCRKPKPGLLTEARYKWQLDLDRSFVISDKWPDAQAALAVGATSLLIQSPWLGNAHHDLVVKDFRAAVDKLLQLHGSPVAVAG
jgi:D-glycero-D-manno-heptose 1,7-bisphosphate phosphatase